MAKEQNFLNIFYVFLGLSGATILPIQFVLTDDLNVQPSEFELIFKIAAFMWMFKFVVGFVCNRVVNQINSYKLLLTVMLCMNSLAWFFLSSWSPVKLETKESITGLLCVIFSTLCVCDVATDGRMIKHVQKESSQDIGKTQTYTWAARSFGRLIGGVAVTILIERKGGLEGKVSPRQFLDGFVVIPLLFVMVLWGGIEPARRNFRVDNTEKATFQETLAMAWTLIVKNKRILAFLVLLFVTPSTGSNMWLYLSESVEHHGLGFGTELLGFIGIIHSVSCIVGAILYKSCFRRWNIRKLFVISLLVGSVISALQLILLTGVYKDIGISPKAFVLSDDVVNSILDEFLMLPLMIVLANTIDSGFETVGYAFFTSLENVVSALSSVISASMTNAFGIKRDPVDNSVNFDNLWIMVIICSVLGLLPIVIIKWIPASLDKYGIVGEEDEEQQIELTGKPVHAIENSDSDSDSDSNSNIDSELASV